MPQDISRMLRRELQQVRRHLEAAEKSDRPPFYLNPDSADQLGSSTAKQASPKPKL